MQLFNNIESEIISSILKAEFSLKIAVTWFTNHDIFNAIIEKLKNPNFKVDLIVLNDRINNKREGVDFQKLIDLNGNFYFSRNENMVHHKFCIVDNSFVITGSYNWTYYAENRNWENVVILSDKEIVNGYVEEFEKILDSHEKIENILTTQNINASVTSNDYLLTDYEFQAKSEQKKGNDLAVAKIYTELLRINTKQQDILEARKEIVRKYNSESFEVCPFEIGILYKNGYSMAIPAFVNLPFSVVKGGRTTSPGAESLQVNIQKNDYIKTTISQFSLDKIQPSPEGTEKIKHYLTLEKNGILTVHCKEVNGYGREKIVKIDIKNWL